MRGDSMTNETQTFIILQKIKQREFVKGRTITEIAKELGTTRNLMQSIIHKILKYQDFIELFDDSCQYRKKFLYKYKDFYVFKTYEQI